MVCKAENNCFKGFGDQKIFSFLSKTGLKVSRGTMKYTVDKKYVDEDGSTRFYEFRKGTIDYENDENPHWKEDSLYIGDDTVWELQLDSFFSEILEDYDCTGETIVTPHQWEKLAARAEEAGGKWREVIEELAPWVDETFTVFDCFTISGM